MPRYHFHLTDRLGRTPDDAGVELESAAVAYDYAVAALREIVAEDAARGILSTGAYIDIDDEAGHVIRVWCREAFADARAGEGHGPPLADNDNIGSAPTPAAPRFARRRSD